MKADRDMSIVKRSIELTLHCLVGGAACRCVLLRVAACCV